MEDSFMLRKRRFQRVVQKLKLGVALFSIWVLLPYVVTVFVSGPQILGIDKKDSTKAAYVSYDSGEKERQIGWEEYFIGVLAEEMPADWNIEALKAQAVVLRTTLYQTFETTKTNGVTMDYLSRKELEKKWGIYFSGYLKKYQKAMQETQNEILRFQGETAELPFHRSSNGSTRNASEVWESNAYPYLAAKECPADKQAEEEMHVVCFTYEELEEKLRPELEAVREEEAGKALELADFEIRQTDSAGYVTKIQVQNTVFSGEKFRKLLGLASGAFSLKEWEGQLMFMVTGNGHGLGMSQWTANEMARTGSSYQEILEYFFAGTELEQVEEIFEKTE